MIAGDGLNVDFKQDFFKIAMPEYVGWLAITPDFRIHSTVWPNPWRRFWHWALLGWRFEREIDTTIRRYERKPIKPKKWWAPPGCEAAAQALVDAWPQETTNGTD